MAGQLCTDYYLASMPHLDLDPTMMTSHCYCNGAPYMMTPQTKSSLTRTGGNTRETSFLSVANCCKKAAMIGCRHPAVVDEQSDTRI